MNGVTPVHIGTGFIVGCDKKNRFIVMTNAHVVGEAMRVGWKLSKELKLACDFVRYTSSTVNQRLYLEDEYIVHPIYDLALLYLDKEYVKESHTSLDSLSISGLPPAPTIGLKIGIIGHPSFNSNLDPFPKYFGFGNEFGVKRFSPGYIRLIETRHWHGHDVEVLLHDATTLSGSSGSCVLDLDSLKVVGLHFGGWPLQTRFVYSENKDILAQLFYANGAVPLWTLRDDPLLDEVTFT